METLSQTARKRNTHATRFPPLQFPAALYWSVDSITGEFISSQSLDLEETSDVARREQWPPSTKAQLTLLDRTVELAPELCEHILSHVKSDSRPCSKPLWSQLLEAFPATRSDTADVLRALLQPHTSLSLPVARVAPKSNITTLGEKPLCWESANLWEWRTCNAATRLEPSQNVELLCLTVVPVEGWTGSEEMTHPLTALPTLPDQASNVDVTAVFEWEGVATNHSFRAEICKLVESVRQSVPQQHHVFVRAAKLEAGVLSRFGRVEVASHHGRGTMEAVLEAAAKMAMHLVECAFPAGRVAQRREWASECELALQSARRQD